MKENIRYIDRNVYVPKEVVKNIDVYRQTEVPKRIYKDFVVEKEVPKYIDRDIFHKVDVVKKSMKYVDVPYIEERPIETIRYVEVEKIVEVVKKAASNGNSTGEDCISQKEFIEIWNSLMKVNPDDFFLKEDCIDPEKMMTIISQSIKSNYRAYLNT